jgi:hypothetical protein
MTAITIEYQMGCGGLLERTLSMLWSAGELNVGNQSAEGAFAMMGDIVYRASTTVAIPWPTPIHIVASP